MQINPIKVGVKYKNVNNLQGQDPSYNAEKIIEIFSGKENEFSEAVCLNSAAALIVSGKFDKFEEGFQYLYLYYSLIFLIHFQERIY